VRSRCRRRCSAGLISSRSYYRAGLRNVRGEFSAPGAASGRPQSSERGTHCEEFRVIYATPLTDFAAGRCHPRSMLCGVVALVLLIAAANVAGLLVARASAAQPEFAIRTALGRAPRAWCGRSGGTLLLAAVAAMPACLPGDDRNLCCTVPHLSARDLWCTPSGVL